MAPGAYIGRASGRAFDARRALAYPPYDSLPFEVPVLSEGDVNARVWIRVREVEQSLSLIGPDTEPASRRLVDDTGGRSAGGTGRHGDSSRGFAATSWFGCACGMVGSNGGRMRDPSWFQWPLLEAVVENNIVADFPLCNKSFNCSYSGHDL